MGFGNVVLPSAYSSPLPSRLPLNVPGSATHPLCSPTVWSKVLSNDETEGKLIT